MLTCQHKAPRFQKQLTTNHSPLTTIMDMIQFAGHVGAFLSSVTFIPQVYRVWKTRSATDLSMTMMLIVFSSTLIWLYYGVSLMLWPVILANSVIAVLSLMLIYFKVIFRGRA